MISFTKEQLGDQQSNKFEIINEYMINNTLYGNYYMMNNTKSEYKLKPVYIGTY